MDIANTRTQPMVEWNQLNWRKLERVVFKLQKRIYKASSRGDVLAVRRLPLYADAVLVSKMRALYDG